MGHRDYSPEFRNAMVSKYESGINSRELSEKYGVSSSTICRWVREAGGKMRRIGAAYTLNEQFFSLWTSDMAYILGFAFADGSLEIDRTHRKHRLAIYQKNTTILMQIAKAIDYSGPLCHTTAVPCLRLNSKVLVTDLLSLGLEPANSLTMQIPCYIEYPQDFVRGYFDGDGYGGWYQRRPREKALRIGFASGSSEFLIGLARLLPMPIGGPYGKGSDLCLLTTALEDAIALRDWMYSGQSNLHIPRKKTGLYQ